MGALAVPIVGSLVGAVASKALNGGSHGGAGGSQTTQQAEPWAPIQPMLQNLYANANNWYNTQQPSFYPYNTIAPQTPETLLANRFGANRAMYGSPYESAAQRQGVGTLNGMGFSGNPSLNYLLGSMNGRFIGKNPYLKNAIASAQQPLVTQFANSTLPGITSMFALGGRYGSNAHQSTISDAEKNLLRGLGDVSTNMGNQAYGLDRSLQQQSVGMLDQMYNAERQRQIQAMGLAPQMQGMDYQNLAALSGIGQNQQNFGQQNINADMSRFGYNRDFPYEQLAKFSSLLSGAGSLGKQVNETMTKGYNPFIRMLGSANAGKALFDQIFGSGNSYQPNLGDYGGYGNMGGYGGGPSYGPDPFESVPVTYGG